LGLSITAEAIRLHGGQVKAANCDNGGLLVELKLPLHDRSTDAEPRLSKQLVS
jgi:K+-sensing histidine kinase KdpD